MFLYQRRRRRQRTAGTNSPPNTPSIGTPTSVTSSGVTLSISAFSDPDVGDTHTATQWRITRASDSVVVYNPGDDAVNLTSLAWSGGAASTAYTGEARTKDNHGNYSPWSATTAFTTAAGSTVYGSEAFTDTNGVALHSHVPVPVGTNPAGTAWTDLNGTFNALQILNGRLAVVGAVTSGTFRSVMSQAATPAADQLASADLVMFTSIPGMRIGLGVGMSGGGAVGGYYLKFNQGSPNQFVLERLGDDFSSTILGGPTSFTFPGTPGTVVPITLRRVGSVITATVNGSVMFSVTDPTPLSGTKCGVMAQPEATGTNATATTGVHLDNLVFQSYP